MCIVRCDVKAEKLHDYYEYQIRNFRSIDYPTIGLRSMVCNHVGFNSTNQSTFKKNISRNLAKAFEQLQYGFENSEVVNYVKGLDGQGVKNYIK